MTGSRRLLPAIVLASAVLVACSSETTVTGGGGGSGTTGATASTGASGTTGPGSSGGASGSTGGGVEAGSCSNAYFPTALGTTWQYMTSDRPGGTISYTDEVTGASDGGFEVTSTLPHVTKTTGWSCGSDGLVVLDYRSGPGASLNANEVSGEINVDGATGVTIPANLAPGDAWTQSFEISGTFDAVGTQAEFTGTIDYCFSAGPSESVSVGAGTFDAIAVSMGSSVSIVAKIAGTEATTSIDSTGTIWLAPDVGIVQGDSSGQGFSAHIELTGFEAA